MATTGSGVPLKWCLHEILILQNVLRPLSGLSSQCSRGWFILSSHVNERGTPPCVTESPHLSSHLPARSASCSWLGLTIGHEGRAERFLFRASQPLGVCAQTRTLLLTAPQGQGLFCSALLAGVHIRGMQVSLGSFLCLTVPGETLQNAHPHSQRS